MSKVILFFKYDKALVFFIIIHKHNNYAQIFRSQFQKNFIYIFLFFLSTSLTFSQSRLDNISVSGKVFSSDSNEGIPSVSIKIKGTNKGTNSDANGNYAIIVPNSEAILVFSFVGYISKEVAVGSQTEKMACF